MNLRTGHIIIGLLIVVFSSISHSCRVSYSFTGASIPPEAKTVSIQYFENNAPLVMPTLSQVITDKLVQRFQSQTSLDMVNQNGDLQFSGAIVDYEPAQPVAIQGNETAAMNRMTIKVKVKFTNLYDETADFETTFSQYSEYNSSTNLSSIQDQLIEEICEALVDDIFNKSVVNW